MWTEVDTSLGKMRIKWANVILVKVGAYQTNGVFVPSAGDQCDMIVSGYKVRLKGMTYAEAVTAQGV